MRLGRAGDSKTAGQVTYGQTVRQYENRVTRIQMKKMNLENFRKKKKSQLSVSFFFIKGKYHLKEHSRRRGRDFGLREETEDDRKKSRKSKQASSISCPADGQAEKSSSFVG